MRKIILASQSPRRQELLKDIVNHFEICPSDVEEIVPDGIKTESVAEYLATIKAEDVAKSHKGCVVIGSDTVVVVDDVILGKPNDREKAYQMLSLLSGKVHKVITGCAIVCDDKKVSFSVETKVEFFDLSDKDINEYIDTDDCYDKAGAYGIQSQGKTLVKSIEGDYYSVVGLPVARLKRELDKFVDSVCLG